MFTKTSRYYELPDYTHRAADGREVVYKGRRFVPRHKAPVEGTTTVGQSERLDVVAARTVGHGELYWHLCDANDVLSPFDLVDPPGQRLVVPEI